MSSSLSNGGVHRTRAGQSRLNPVAIHCLPRHSGGLPVEQRCPHFDEDTLQGRRPVEDFPSSSRVLSGRLLSFSAQSTTKGGSRTMANRYEISIEPIGSSGVMLTIAELPRIVIFGET